MEIVVVLGTNLVGDDDSLFTLTIAKASLIHSCKLNTKLSQVFTHVCVSRAVVTIAVDVEDQSLGLRQI